MWRRGRPRLAGAFWEDDREVVAWLTAGRAGGAVRTPFDRTGYAGLRELLAETDTLPNHGHVT